MVVLAIGIKHPLDVTVQCAHEADPRKHGRAAALRDQEVVSARFDAAIATVQTL
jgi:hypothetical protein